jgi:hypothetical protein
MLFVKYKQGIHLEKFVYEKHIVFWFFFYKFKCTRIYHLPTQEKTRMHCECAHTHYTTWHVMPRGYSMLYSTSGWVGEVFGGGVILVLCWDVAVLCGVLAAVVWGDGTWNYKDTKSKMSSLQVFNRVYRLEIQSVMLVFSTPLVNCCPSTFSRISPQLFPPPFPK